MSNNINDFYAVFDKIKDAEAKCLKKIIKSNNSMSNYLLNDSPIKLGSSNLINNSAHAMTRMSGGGMKTVSCKFDAW